MIAVYRPISAVLNLIVGLQQQPCMICLIFICEPLDTFRFRLLICRKSYQWFILNHFQGLQNF